MQSWAARTSSLKDASKQVVLESSKYINSLVINARHNTLMLLPATTRSVSHTFVRLCPTSAPFQMLTSGAITEATRLGSSAPPFVWLGDVGRACGQSWEHGASVLYGGNQKPYAPSCVWMDKDHGDDINQKSKPDVTITNRQMKINMYEYASIQAANGTTVTTTDLDKICGSTIFSWDMDDPIVDRTPRGMYWDSDGQHDDPVHFKRRDSTKTQQRKARPQSAKMAERLWVNSRPSQSAVELCNSPTSRGSDFVSTNEGLFCDMDTKTLYPLCSKKKTVGCFDLHADKLQLRRRGGAKLQSRSKSVKQYKKITYSD